MRLKIPVLLFILMAFALISCEKSPIGPGKSVIDKHYFKYSFLTNMYTSSMIRAATDVAKIDTLFTISRNTEYLLQFEVEKDYRGFKPETDSLVTLEWQKYGLEPLMEYEQEKSSLKAFVKSDEGTITNLLITKEDSLKYSLYEFVGTLPMETIFKEGVSNYESILNFMNLNEFTNAGINTSNR